MYRQPMRKTAINRGNQQTLVRGEPFRALPRWL
jgi:hypothetical protein